MSCSGCEPIKIMFMDAPDIPSIDIMIEDSTEYSIKLLNSDLLKSAPKEPLNFRVLSIIDDATVLVAWNNISTSYDHYRAYAENVETGIIEQVVDDIGATQTQIRNLQGETEYKFWVVSIREGVESARSNYDYATTLP